MNTRPLAATLRTILAVALATLLATTLGTQPAQAAHWRNIKGAVYAKIKWFNSKTIRKKEGKGPIDAKFSKIPGSLSSDPPGLWFGVKSKKTRKWMGASPREFPREDQKKRLTVNTSNGKKFFTSFKRRVICTGILCSHTFVGKMRY
ncbi:MULTISPECIES: hypothetical protein [Nonomuraea]|nr:MULTISPECIES: hypothetical protein [Nonomuraea]TDE41387.1 hypothetical protein E1295_30360 [Nonomuraea mesophila]